MNIGTTHVRDQWFVVGIILIAILALYAPKVAGVMVLLIAVYLGVGPLNKVIRGR